MNHDDGYDDNDNEAEHIYFVSNIFFFSSWQFWT